MHIVTYTNEYMIDEVDGLVPRALCLYSNVPAVSMYAAVSTDLQYEAPSRKITVYKYYNRITEERVFRMLDSLKKTSLGLDDLPSWFSRLLSPFRTNTATMEVQRNNARC